MIPDVSNRATRAAWLGLALVVLCLGAFSIVGAYLVQTRVEQARRGDVRHGILENASAALLLDEAMQLENLVLPSAEHDAERAAADQHLVAMLAAIGAQDGPGDAELAKALASLHQQYISVYDGIAVAAAGGDQAEVIRLHGIEDPLYIEMSEQITAATEAAQATQESTFATLDTTSRWMLFLAPIIFAFGAALLLGLWRILSQADRAKRKTYREMEQLSKLRGEFVSTVSHEFRTPLTGIQGFSELMRDEVLTVDTMREYAGDINKDAQRLSRLISDMLDLDRMESGLMTLATEPVDLNRILVDVAALFKLSAGAHPIVLHLDEGLPTLSADSDRLTQVVSNLLSNAIKYSPGGGAVEVQTTHGAGAVTLTIRDHGVGIPGDDLERIFQRYSRLDTPATRDIQGTGLGLPIVRQIVQHYAGKVWATSGNGGSVFHVQLPVAA